MKNKLFSIILIIAVVCMAFALCVNAAFKGDVNGDGMLANNDLSLLIKYLSGGNVNADQNALDADGNGKINNRDAIALIKVLAGWEAETNTESEMPRADFPASPTDGAACYYISASKGSDSNSGKSKDKALKTLTRAYALAEAGEGEAVRIIFADSYTITESFTEPSHKKSITLSADGGKLAFSGNYRFVLSGNTAFENITVEYKGTVNFVANYNYITFGDGVTLKKTGSGNGAYVVGGYQSPSASADVTKNSHIRINSGEFWAVIGSSRQAASGAGELDFTGYSYIEVNGGKINTLYGGSTSNHTLKDAYIKINGGEISTLCAAGEMTRSLTGDALIELDGGVIDFLNINNVLGDSTVKQNEAFIRTANVSYYNLDLKARATAAGGAKVFVYPDGKHSENALLDLTVKFDAAIPRSAYVSKTQTAQNVIFVSGDASGSGNSASDAASLSTALGKVKDGGVIVISGRTEINGSMSYTNSKKVTFTSKYGGVNYAKENGAALVFSVNFKIGGDTLFEHIRIVSTTNYKSIYAQNHELTIGDNVICVKTNDEAKYMSLMGGSTGAYKNAESHLTINSGTWQRVRGGTAADGSTNYRVSLTVNGGRFIEAVTLGSSLSHSGDIDANINGGIFFGGITASTLSKDTQTFDSNVSLTIGGGVFYQSITSSTTGIGTYKGSFNVSILGGEFAHLVTLTGAEELSGSMSSHLTSSIDLGEKETGVYSFSNPVQGDGADPWIFYNNGYYYYIATGGSALRLRRAANIGDLPHAESKIIYDPEDGHMWSKNLWSPEIHYYSDEQIGKGNGGWYCYIACDDGNNTNHRMYVIKCLDGNDLFGRWGNPVTGEVNVPQKIEATDIPDFDNTWAAGQTDIMINNQLYLMYVTEKNRGTKDFHQTINIVKMTNPWTITGQSYPICKPDYDWEMHGHAVSAETGKVWPKVVEGGTAVYGDNGEIYIIYSGSGYWTTYYALGQLKYMGGDPLDASSWQKSPEPIFSKNNQINGCGHASYVTDTSGQRWICYHAYTGTNTDSGRDAFIEPYSVDSNGVTIGSGTKHPADLSKVYTAELNPLSLREKTSCFTNIDC